MTGLDVLSMIRAEGLSTKFVFLSAAASDGQILTAITGGATGIILKDVAPDSLAECIRLVAGGGTWFPADIVDGAMEREVGRPYRARGRRCCAVFMKPSLPAPRGRRLGQRNSTPRVSLCR
jgi:DNA-binding NarL/FixJ family response regulator